MSWKETDSMKERERFIGQWLSHLYSISELARQYGISRKTAYKWIGRYQQGGFAALADQSRAPLNSPQSISAEDAQEFIAMRRAHPTWGPVLIRDVLQDADATRKLPAPSTIGALLTREGLTVKRARRHQRDSPERSAAIVTSAANQEWDCDFKGDFLLGDRSRCYPLTITDAHTRMLLGCRAQTTKSFAEMWPNFRRVLQEYGLPESIRSDNGEPFGGLGPRGLSRFTLELIKLGIAVVRNRPGCPQDNPRHERMHRTLKADATFPRATTMRQQQAQFDAFRTEYNTLRTHSSIGRVPPARLYTASPRELPHRPGAAEYEGHWEIRRVAPSGAISFKARKIFVSSVLIGEDVGLCELDNGIWEIRIYDYLVGRFDERDGRLY